MENRVAEMHILDVNTVSPFKDIFPIRENVLKEIVADMKANGYDPAHPIILWAGHRASVIDGHTRLAAAKTAGVMDVPVVTKDFSDEREALEYAIRSQRNRRNLTDAELLTCLNELDKRKARGGNPIASREAIGKSAEKTADLLGVSRAKVERLRTVHDHAPEQIREAVSTGKLSVNKAYKATMDARKAEAAEAACSSPEALGKIRKERSKALSHSIVGMIRTRLEREVQEYPDIHYSDTEKTELVESIAAEIRSLINNTLLGEHDDEK